MKGHDIYKIKNPGCIYWDEVSSEIEAFLKEDDEVSVIVKTPKWLKTVIQEAVNQAYTEGADMVRKSLRDLINAKKEG